MVHHVGGIAGLREKGVDVPEATTVGGILANEWSKVERNRDLARHPTPYTVHGELGMISSVEFRALPYTTVGCQSSDKGGRERKREGERGRRGERETACTVRGNIT